MADSLFDLSGKVALVTGGVGILGRHFCEGLAKHGAQVAVVDLDRAVCDSFAVELSSRFGVECSGVSCNVADPESTRAMVDEVVSRHGGIHVLMNNAASKSKDLAAFFAPFEEYTLDEWRSIMSVNLDGMMLVDQAVGKQMIRQGKGGSVVHTASIYGVVAPDQRIYEGSEYMGVPINTPAVYSASKAGIIGLARYLATYWAPHGIRVNVLTPGGNESGQNQTFIDNYSRRVPLGRMGQPPEMVGALVYLASDASSYVTGQNIIVDGGLSAW